MFWFKKKAVKPEDEQQKNIVETENEGSTLFSDSEQTDSEDIIAEADEAFADNDESEETEGAEEAVENTEEAEETQVREIAVKIKSLDELAEFMNSRRPGGLQFMRVENHEAFEIREAHIRLARVWGSVSMSRECTPEEYGKIMLAMELISSQEDFYVLPTPSEEEIKANIAEFCRKKYSSDEKRFVKSPEKFARFINENGDADEWKAFIKEKKYDIACDFCEKHGIVFESEENTDD